MCRTRTSAAAVGPAGRTAAMASGAAAFPRESQA